MALNARLRSEWDREAGLSGRRLPYRSVLGAVLGSVLGLGAVVLMASVALAQSPAAPAAAETPAAPVAATQDHPVVLELFTAQGCSSCPPADEMLINLAARDDVIPLALHVDYWDYIGWADTFADHAFTLRQQRYARRYGHTTIYTPQVVLNGVNIIEGFRVMQVMDGIAALRQRAPDMQLTIAMTEGGLRVQAQPMPGSEPVVALASRRSGVADVGAHNSVTGTLSIGADASTATVPQDAAPQTPQPYVVELVRYRPRAQVDILGGENAGRTAVYANIVTQMRQIGTWDMRSPFEMTVPLDGADPVVVFVQEAGQGEIVGAARLR